MCKAADTCSRAFVIVEEVWKLLNKCIVIRCIVERECEDLAIVSSLASKYSCWLTFFCIPKSCKHSDTRLARCAPICALVILHVSISLQGEEEGMQDVLEKIENNTLHTALLDPMNGDSNK